MNVIALPGRREETAVWMSSLLMLAQHTDARVARYRHWESDAEADVAYEAERLSGASAQLVVAKSMGTIIASTAHDAYRFRPAFGIFVGTPFAAVEEQEIRLLRRFAAEVPTLFIQQAQDPGGAASELAAALQLQQGEAVEVPGNDHLYLDIEGLAKIMRKWQDLHLKPRP